MSKRKQLVEKIIREELVGYAKKILDEGMRTPYMNLPDAPPDRAIAPNKKRSTVTSIVDEPDLKQHYVEEKISDRLEEEASESDSKDYGVNTTSAMPAGGDETGKIAHVPGYPLESDKTALNESQVHRWKKLAGLNEQELGGMEDIEDIDAEPFDAPTPPAGDTMPPLDIDTPDAPPEEIEPIAPEEPPPIDAPMGGGQAAADIEKAIGDMEDDPELAGDVEAPAHRDDHGMRSGIEQAIRVVLKEKLLT